MSVLGTWRCYSTAYLGAICGECLGGICLKLLLTRGEVEWEIDRRIGAMSSMMRMLYWSSVVLVNISSYPHLWLQALDSDQKSRLHIKAHSGGAQSTASTQQKEPPEMVWCLTRLLPGHLLGKCQISGHFNVGANLSRGIADFNAIIIWHLIIDINIKILCNINEINPTA